MTGRNMKHFFQGMKLVSYLASVSCRNCLLNEGRSTVNRIFHNYCLVGPPLKIFTPNLTRNFTIYTSFCTKADEFQKNSAPSQSKRVKTVPKVSVVDSNGVEAVMTFSDAEKLAKRKKMKLVLVETGRTNKIKYKLEKYSEFSQKTDTKKAKQKDNKKIVLREETQPHDVEVKINQMLKFLEKGINVLCIIESSKKTEKQGEVFKIIEKSKLKEYFTSKTEGKRYIYLTFSAKLAAKGNSGGENKENAEVSIEKEN